MGALFKEDPSMLTLSPVHRQTPTLTALDPRGLTVRAVGYWRDDGDQSAQARINRMAHDPQGRSVAQWDSRLWRMTQANLATAYSLSSIVLSTVSVDAGWRVGLVGEGAQLLEQWDGRGTLRQTRYDDQLRPVAVFESGESTEQLAYGDETLSGSNQCGRLIRHDDSAGVLLFNGYGLSGALQEQERRFASESNPGFVSQSRLTPLGDMQSRIDAQGNEQRFRQTVDGQLHAVDLRLSNTTQWLPMVSAIRYNVFGQVEKEVAGNGVVTRLEYTAEDGRLNRLLSQLGQEDPLQDLHYDYDPIGNVLSIEDATLPVRYFANQRIEPINRYIYDSLSQLIEATGWEAGTVKQGPLSEPTEILANYRQIYRYDDGNNLLELTHVGAQNPGHRLVAAAHSNRCLPVRDSVGPGEEDFRHGFDANGNLLNLQPGQALSWDLRNQLKEVIPVERDTGPDDSERYIYGADGMRVRKIRSLQTNAKINLIETIYLPGLEIRTHSGTGEELHVIEVKTGRGSVRVLHWEARPPSQIANNQQRYSLSDHLGSTTLELDQHANLITQEHYYPFGGTAWSNGEAIQVSYKTVCYSGKERDATGLYYYGFRYYAPQWQRWISPDPAGAMDGANLFSFVGGNPLNHRDVQGLVKIDINSLTVPQRAAIGIDGLVHSPSRSLYARAFDAVKPVQSVRRVDETTFDSLEQAHVTNLVTKGLLPFGADNQKLDLWRSPLDNKEELAGIRALARNQQVQASLEYGVGNCAEHADIAFHLLASTQTNEPVFEVRAQGADHVFVVIGDSRVLSPGKVVIVDPWPTFPMAHTARFGTFQIGSSVMSASGDADPKYELDDRTLLRNVNYPFPAIDVDAPGTVDRFNSIHQIPTAYTQAFSIQDKYRGIDFKIKGSKTRGNFNRLPEAYVSDRLGHYSTYAQAWARANNL